MLIGIVADDLTGAADSVAPFAQYGMETTVGFELKASVPRFRLGTGEVLAYDTETRDLPHSPEGHIIAPVRSAIRRLTELGARLIYKKIDSALRGHLGLELDAARKEMPGRIALICPAFPANGRTVQSGVLSIYGTPWTSTEFAPPYPLENPTVRAAFGMAQDPTAAEISGSDIRRGAESVEAGIDRLISRGVNTIFCDAADEAHLHTLAEVVLRRPDTYLPVGSAGWAFALAALITPSFLPQFLPDPEFLEERALVIVGSRHQASRQQAAALSESIGASPIVFGSCSDIRDYIFQVADSLWSRYRSGHRIALLTTPDERVVDYASQSWVLGSVTRALCYRGLREGLPIRSLVVAGGKTAIDVCYQMNILGLHVLGQTGPGIVVARLLGEADPVNNHSFDGMPIITKAGGFGDSQTLLRCVGLV